MHSLEDLVTVFFFLLNVIIIIIIGVSVNKCREQGVREIREKGIEFGSSKINNELTHLQAPVAHRRHRPLEAYLDPRDRSLPLQTRHQSRLHQLQPRQLRNQGT